MVRKCLNSCRVHHAVEPGGGVVPALPGPVGGVDAVGQRRGSGDPDEAPHVLAPLPRRRRRRVEGGAGHDGEEVGPGAGHDLGEGVPATPGRHPAPAGHLVGEVVQGEVGGALAVDRQLEVGERVVAVGVAPVLGHQHVGGELAQERRDDGVEGAQPAGVAGAGRQGHVDGRADGVRPAEVDRRARAGEEELARLVQRDGEHARVVPEHALDAVAVVDVDVDVGDPLGALVEQPPDPDGDVVVDAEPARPVGHRVVEAAGDVRAVQRRAAPHLPERLEARAHHVGGRLVHAAEHRHVVGPEAEVLQARAGFGPHLLHRLDEPGVVHGRELVVRGEGGGHGHQAWPDHAELLGEPHRQVDAHRCHRVAGAEVVGREARVEDDGRRAGALHVLRD